MKILTVRPAPPGGSTIAHVDVELVEGAKLFGLRVSRADDGTHRVYGQNSERGRTCSFSRDIVAQIAEASLKSLQMNEPSQHDRTRNQ